MDEDSDEGLTFEMALALTTPRRADPELLAKAVRVARRLLAQADPVPLPEPDPGGVG